MSVTKMTLNKWAVLLIGVLFFTGGHPHSSVDSEAVSVTSYICTSAMQVRMALATEKKIMHEWLAVIFRVTVVSQSISQQNCQELVLLSST